MVERKKTGMPKARKRVRLSLPVTPRAYSYMAMLHSTPGSSVDRYLASVFLCFAGHAIRCTLFTLPWVYNLYNSKFDSIHKITRWNLSDHVSRRRNKEP